MLKPVEPVQAAHLFEGLHAELLRLLRRLEPEQWKRPTAAGSWRVRDVVAHMLDGELRRLSIARDGHRTPIEQPIEGYQDLLRFLNDLNAEWVRAAERISPELLVDLLAHVGPKVAAFMKSVDPLARGPLGVAWAGQEAPPNWLDVGREYTERWHHQDQIREAVGAQALTTPKWLLPVIEISLWSLPHAYRDVRGREGDAVRIETTGTVSGTWSLLREASGWKLFSGGAEGPTCRITLEGDTAARLLLHRLRPETVGNQVVIEGEEQLARPFLEARAVMV